VTKGKSTYNPHLQGSDTDPSPNCDAPVAADTQKDLDNARAAAKIHSALNEQADRSGR
jgi:hypothetical protein